MSYSNELRQLIKSSTLEYIDHYNIAKSDYRVYDSAIIFNNLPDNFHSKTYNNIQGNDWENRLLKKHSHFSDDTKEMSSSNSSDALLMNIFCYPKIKSWTGITKLSGIDPNDLVFGWNPKLETHNSPTEIDMYSKNTIYEAKLTEESFTTQKLDKILQIYPDFEEVFETDILVNNEDVKHYQLIRNILAAKKHDAYFKLIIDSRRPDLMRYFTETVSSIKSFELRTRCSFITWQEITKSVGQDLKSFLKLKYGF